MGQNFLIKLKNRYEEAYLACIKPEQVDSWIKVLDKKKDSDVKVKKTKELEKPVAIRPNLDVKFDLRKVKLSLQSHKDKNWLEFQTSHLCLNMIQFTDKLNVDLRLGSLYVKDYIVNFKNPALENFLTSRDPDQEKKDLINISVIMIDKKNPAYENVDLDVVVDFGILVINLKPDTLSKILLFIKPEEQPPEQKASPTEKKTEAKNESSPSKGSSEKFISQHTINDDSSILKLSTKADTILLRARVNMESIKVFLVHRKIKLILASVELKKSNIIFIQKIDEIYLEGYLGNIRLVDLTNYPSTIYKEDDWQKANEQEILGVADNSQSLVSIKFNSFVDGSPKIISNVVSKVDVKVSAIRVNFIMQPVMRLLDFVLVQVLGVLSNPEYFDSNVQRSTLELGANKSEIVKGNLGPFNNMTALEVLKTIDCPKFMDLNVVLEKPRIHLRARQDSDEYLVVDLGVIEIRSQRNFRKERILNDSEVKCVEKEDRVLSEILCESYCIWMRDMGLKLIKNGKEYDMSMPFHFNFSFERPMFMDEYKFCFPTVNIDKTMLMRSKILPLVLALHQNDYLLIMRTLFFNITYDDLLDRFMIHDFEVIVSQPAEITPIDFGLDIENISVFLMPTKSKGKEDLEVPIARVTLQKLRISFKKLLNSNMEVSLLGKILDGSYFENYKNSILKEYGLLKDLNKYGEYNLEDGLDLFELHDGLKIAKSEGVDKEFSFKEFKKNETCQFQLALIMEPSGKKDITLGIEDIKILVHSKTFLDLSGFAVMDDSVVPPEPDALKNKEISKQEVLRQNVENQQKSEGMLIRISINNVNLCMPCPSSDEVLATKGQITILFNSSPPKTLEEMIKSDKPQDFNEVSNLQVDLKDLELFSCNVADLILEDFKNVRRRSLLLPFDLLIRMKNGLVLTKEHQYFSQTNIKIVITKTLIRVSYKDIMLLKNTAFNQLELMNPTLTPEQENMKKEMEEKEKQKRELEEKEKRRKEKEGEKKREEEKKNQIIEQTKQIAEANKAGDVLTLTSTIIELLHNGIQIVIVNDAGDAFMPILEFTLDETKALFQKNFILTTGTMLITFSSNYYNPQVSRWEPIIEKSSIDFELASSEAGNPKFSIHLEQNKYSENLNITVSTQMLNILLKTMSLWSSPVNNQVADQGAKAVQLDQEEEEKLESSMMASKAIEKMGGSMFASKSRRGMTANLNKEEKVDYVSPYTIRNETGYIIEVEREYTKNQLERIKNRSKLENKKYVLGKGESINFQIEQDVDKMFTHDEESNSFTQEIKIKTCIRSENNEINAIPGIDVDRVRTKRYLLEGSKLLMKDLSLISCVKMDDVSYRKILLLSSSLAFENSTNKVVEINIFIEKGKSQLLTLNPSEIVPIPLDLVKKQINIRYTDSSTWSDIFQLEKFLQNTNDTSFEIKFSQYFSILRIKKEEGGFGKTTISIEPPFILKNCLPIDICLQLISKQQTEGISLLLGPQQVYQEHHISLQNKVFVKAKVQGFFWSDRYNIYSPNSEPNKEIVFKDAFGHLGHCFIYHLEGFSGSKQFFFYVKSYIINESTFDLVFYGLEEKGRKYVLGGQQPMCPEEASCFNDKLILLGEEKKILVAEKETKDLLSKEMVIGGVGTSTVEFKTNKGHLEMGVSLSLVSIDRTSFLYTKMISLAPRFIIVNTFDKKIAIRQAKTDQDFVIIEKDREPYKWHDITREKFINIKIKDDAYDWSWSGNLELSTIGIIHFILKSNKDPSKTIFLRGDLRMTEGLIYFIIDKSEKDQEPYIIENALEGFEIEFRQDEVKNPNICSLPFGKSLPFAWDEPCHHKKEIRMKMKHQSLFYETKEVSLTLDKINSKTKIIVHCIDKKVHKPNIEVICHTTIDGVTKRIRVFSSEKKQEIEEEDEKMIDLDELKKKISAKKEESLEKKPEENKKPINTQIVLSVKFLGLSLVSNFNKKPFEVLFICLRNFEFCILETRKTRIVQARLQYINIDNNSKFDLNFPVIFTPRNYDDCIKKNKFFLNFILEQNIKAKQILLLNSFKFQLEPLMLKIEESFINTILEFVGSLQEGMKTSSSDQQPEGDKGNRQWANSLNKNKKPPLHFWEIEEIPQSITVTYIDEIVLSPFNINLTFQKKASAADADALVLFKMLLNALGVALGNIDDAPIKLSGIKLENCFDSQSGIVSKLITHYKTQATREVFKILGSIDLLGNPVGLFSNIGTGVVDLFEKPMEGFVKGPLEGGIGIVKGAGSLLKNTVSGTFNSINKITGSVATGLSALSLDDEYLKQREKMKMKKAKHVGEGLEQAGVALYKGFEKGITGIFLKPIEGASKDGFKGFLKGTFQGITGLVVKPVAGLLDATSKTAEGIKNTATHFDDKPNEKRERFIRVFYGIEKYYKAFNEGDAEVCSMLQSYKRGRYAGVSFLSATLILPNENTPENKYFLIMTIEFLLYLCFKTKKLDWEIGTNNIKNIEKYSDGLRINLIHRTKKLQDRNAVLPISNPAARNTVYQKINEVIEAQKSFYN